MVSSSFQLREKMWRPLLLLLSVSATVASKNGNLKEDFCNGQGESDNLSEASVQFAISLYKTVTALWARPPPNLFISPLSTYTSLAMLGLGAKSSTRQQILKAMCISESEGRKILKEGYKNFLAELTSEEGNAEFRMSNWLFLDKSIKVSSKYKRYVARYYNASLQTIDFEDPQNAKQEINDQVNGQTDGKMEDLVNELDVQSNMVMVDYAKFIGKWKNPFSAAEKQHGHFRVNQVKTVEVDMMHKLGQYRTFKDDGTIMVEVPYTDQLVLIIIMPKNGNLSEVERTLSAEMIQSYLSKARTSLLDLYIPMISLEKKINVHFALLYMGISEVFGENADLSGISKHQKLKASMLYHKILFKLATEGTESSGAEITQGLTVPRAVDLRIDQPFFTMVYNKQLKTIMFMGRVRDPSREFSST